MLHKYLVWYVITNYLMSATFSIILWTSKLKQFSFTSITKLNWCTYLRAHNQFMSYLSLTHHAVIWDTLSRRPQCDLTSTRSARKPGGGGLSKWVVVTVHTSLTVYSCCIVLEKSFKKTKTMKSSISLSSNAFHSFLMIYIEIFSLHTLNLAV